MSDHRRTHVHTHRVPEMSRWLFHPIQIHLNGSLCMLDVDSQQVPPLKGCFMLQRAVILSPPRTAGFLFCTPHLI